MVSFNETPDRIKLHVTVKNSTPEPDQQLKQGPTKVISIVPPARKTPNPHMIADLEELLEKARNGEFNGIAYVAKEATPAKAGTGFQMEWLGDWAPLELIGAAESLKFYAVEESIGYNGPQPAPTEPV